MDNTFHSSDLGFGLDVKMKKKRIVSKRSPEIVITTVGDCLQSVTEIDEVIAELERQIGVLREARELLKGV